MKLRVPPTYRHELRHMFTSRAIVVIAILTVLAGVSALASVDSATNSFPIYGAVVFYYAEGAYHATGWAFDAGGAPVSGVVAQFTAVNVSSQNSIGGPYAVTTNAQGEFTLSVAVPDSAWTWLRLDSVQLDSSRSVRVLWGGIFSVGGYVYLGFVPLGSASGSQFPFTVGTDFFSAHAQVLVFLEGPNGTVPIGYQVQTCFTGPAFIFPPRSNCTGLPTEELGSVTGYWTHFPLPEYPSNATNIYVQVVSSSGTIVQSIDLYSTQTTQDSSTVVINAPGESILTGFAEEASFFFPAMALVAGYWTYARPRLSATVEPVLARPVTRGGMFLARYASLASVITAAAIADVLILDASAITILGEPLPIGYLAPLIGSLLVAALGCLALVFLIAHAVRTSAAAIGSGSGVLVLGFFWSSLILGLLILNNPAFDSLTATLFLLRSQLFLPPQFPGLSTSLLIGVSPFGTPFGSVPGGVSFALAAVVGTAWVLIPAAMAYWLAIGRD